MKKKGKRVRFAILAVLVVFLALAIFSVFPSIVSIPGSNHSILGGISNVLSITGNAIRNAVNSSQAPAVIFPKANRSSIGNLKIGTPSPSKFGFAQAYSIDASGLDFKSADVKAVAKGNYLFKCKDWDFALQSCSGSWVTIMNGLSVGQGYDFSLTRGDPGFAEINITTAQHLDENRSVISDIYPQISAQDGIWSEPVYANQYVRAWFSENMTNGNVINIYARNNQSSNTSIEVYEKDGSVLLASTPVIAEPGMYDVALSNMNDSSDTFDLKIFNADNDSNAYLEFDYLHDAIFNTGASNCSAEQTATKGSFGAVCNGTYPAACGSGGSYLGCADGYNETHSMTSTGYAGVRIKQYNLSVSDCQSVDSVYLCYKWNTTDPGGDCYIAIDNQNGTNFTNMTTTCPVGAPSFTCTNVTLNKTWACENFFSSSGNKSMITS